MYKQVIVAALLMHIAVQSVFANEMDISKAEWVCPSSVKNEGKIHIFKQMQIYSNPPEENRILEPESGNDLYQYRYSGLDTKGENIYLVCQYNGLAQGLILHAENAVFCGVQKTGSKTIPFQGACWGRPSEWPAADEMDMNKAKWICPSSVAVKGVEYKFDFMLIYDNPPEENKVVTPSDRKKGARYRDLSKINTYLACEYNDMRNRKVELIIYAKDATFCGVKKTNSKNDSWQGACWNTPHP